MKRTMPSHPGWTLGCLALACLSIGGAGCIVDSDDSRRTCVSMPDGGCLSKEDVQLDGQDNCEQMVSVEEGPELDDQGCTGCVPNCCYVATFEREGNCIP